MEAKRFTADHAREAMGKQTRIDYFGRYMQTIYTQIALHAKNGFNCYICKTLYYASKMKMVIDQLEEDGYYVEYDCMNDKMAIYW